MNKLIVHFTDTEKFAQLEKTMSESDVEHYEDKTLKEKGREIANNGFWYRLEGENKEVFIPESNVHKVEIVR